MNVLTTFWTGLSLARQFALASFVVLLIGMASVSAWVSHKIEEAVIHNSSVAAALYVDSLVAPLLQELEYTNELSDQNKQELDKLLSRTPVGERVLSFKIWLEGGYITYSSHASLSGKTFPVTDSLAASWKGLVSADFDQLDDDEDARERDSGLPLLEIYSPVRSWETGEILAVCEFYTLADELDTDLVYAKLQSWLLFAGVGTAMFLALSNIAIRGSRTIELQQQKLNERVLDLSDLRTRVENASRKNTEMNEHYLRRIGSDLHDGPSQLIALALLKMDGIQSEAVGRVGLSKASQIDITRDSLAEALNEIRNITAGLAMPEIEGLTVDQTLRKAVKAHEVRSGMRVPVVSDDCQIQFPHSILICVYRFVQETLNNVHHHGDAKTASISITFEDDTLQVCVGDEGRGFDVSEVTRRSTGFGLPGLRERIESVGGFFDIISQPGHGTVVSARFVIAK